MKPAAAALLVTLVVGFSAYRAGAAEKGPGLESNAAEAAQHTVHVVIVGTDSDVAALKRALVDPFERLQIALRVERALRIDASRIAEPQSADGTATQLSFDLSRPSRAFLYLTDRNRERVYVRNFELPQGLDEVAVEQLVVAARSSVQAILTGAPIGVRRAEYERSIRPIASAPRRAPAKATSSTGPRGFLASDYEAQLLAPNAISHGPGLALWLSDGGFALRTSVRGRLPLRSGDDDVRVRLTGLSARVTGILQRRLAPRWLFSGGVGGGLDLTLVHPERVRATQATLQDASWVADPIIQGMAGVTHQLKELRLSALMGTDLALVRARYTIERAGKRQPLLVPWTVRPFISIELAIALWP